ncbi:MAG: DUF4836 family protein [Saprospiraceae bacterium]
MHFELRSPLFFLILVLLFASCSSKLKDTDTALKYIPSDAISATSIHLETLLEKMDFEGMKQMSFFKDALEEVSKTDPELAGFLADPWSMGIALDKPIYVIQQVNTKNPSEVFMAVMATVHDAAAVNKMMSLMEGERKNGSGFEYVEIDESLAAWNEELVVFGSGTESMDLQKYAEQLFQTTPEESLMSRSDIQPFSNSTHDISTMLTLDAIPDISDAALALSLSGISPESLKGGHAFGYLDFGNGAIDGRATWDFDREFSKHFAPFFKDKPKKNLLGLLPVEGLAMEMSGALSPEGIHLFLSERPQYKSMTNYTLQSAGLQVDDVLEALGGDLAVGVYNQDVIMVTDVKDSKAFDKLLEAGRTLALLTDSGDGMYRLNDNFADPEMYLVVKNNLALLGSDPQVLADIAEGKGKKNRKFAESLFSMSMDLVGMRWLMADMDLSTGLADDFIAAFGGMKADVQVDREEMNVRMDMENKDANILATIIMQLEEAYQSENENTLNF